MKRVLLLCSAVLLSMAAQSQELEVISRYNRPYFKTTEPSLRFGVTSFEDRTVQLLYCEEWGEAVIVPSTVEHDGVTYTVTSVGHSAFGMNHSLGRVYLPASIKEVDGNAFYGTRATVNVPDSVERIGAYAYVLVTFANNVVHIPATTRRIEPHAFAQSSFTAYEVDPDNPWYMSMDGVLYSKDTSVLVAYPPMKHETSYVIPEGVTRIETAALSMQQYLLEITLPQSLRELGPRSLGMDLCSVVHIPAGVNHIEGNPVYTSTILLDSSADGQPNVHYRMDGGRLMSMDGDTLLGWPGARGTVTVPQGVRVLGMESLSNYEEIDRLILPEGLEVIMDGAVEYSGCYCNIPSTVRHIGAHALAGDRFDTIRLPQGLTYLGSNAFFQSGSTACELYLPNSLRVIPDSAFFSSFLYAIHWAEGLEEIGVDAFAWSGDIDTARAHRLPSTLRRVCLGAFGMSNFKKLHFTGVLDTMGAQMGGASESEVRLVNTTPPVIYTGAFNPGNSLLSITVPCGSLQNYLNAGGCWDEYDPSAFREDCEGVEPVAAAGATVIDGHGRVTVGGAAGRLVEVFNTQGVRVAAAVAASDPQSFPLPAAGIYLVRIGSEIHKVAVR